MIDNAAASHTHVGSAIPVQRSDGRRTGAHRSDSPDRDSPDRADANVAGADQDRPAWSHGATMILPAFVTGRIEAAAHAAADAVAEAMTARTPADAVAAAGHARDAANARDAAYADSRTEPLPTVGGRTATPAVEAPDRERSDRLPSSERNMLIFVAMLLALGTIAVVATMGVGKFG